LLRSIFTLTFFQLGYHLDVKVAKKAILEGFRKTDELLLQKSVSGGWQDGATAVCVWILDQKV
jgi:integrin-linked kinase-associated serine/threonine phosphatase 2C